MVSHHPPQRRGQRTTHGSATRAHRVLDTDIRLSPRGLANGHRPRRQAVVHTYVMHKPAAKGAAIVPLGRLKQHQLALQPRTRTPMIVRPPAPPYENYLLVLAVYLCGESVFFRRNARVRFPLGDEAAHLALEVHEQALCAAAALQLLAQLLGDHARRRGAVGHGAGGVFRGDDIVVALGGLALQAGVPQRGEVVGHVADAVGGVDFPVLGGRGLGVRVGEEAIWLVCELLVRFAS